MGHLTRETLARLVDRQPSPEEAGHLELCAVCAGELEALRRQTEALGDLPEIRPPVGDWQILEARLRSEGLIEVPGLLARWGLAHTPTWMRTAAAVLLFLGGTGVGAVVTRHAAGPNAGAGEMSQATFTSATSLDDAATNLRRAETSYVAALARYRQLLARADTGQTAEDPRSRYAALEYLVAASQAAIRQAPADPFFNGLLASTLAERDVTLRRISASGDNWF